MSKKKGAGNLHHLVEIQHYQESQNDLGESLKSWTLFKKAWAEIKPISGKEFFQASKENNEVSHRVIIRFIDGILPSMRVKFKDRFFDIESSRDYFERNKYLELMCKEIVL